MYRLLFLFVPCTVALAGGPPARPLASVRGALASPPATVAVATSIPIRLDLGDAWKVNETAGTWLALFRGKGKGATRVVAIGREDARRGEVRLPALAPGEYRLQGQIYYCRKAAVSACLLQGHDQAVLAAPGGSPSLEIVVGTR